MAKLVFVLIDALNVSSIEHMSYLAAHKEHGALCGVFPCELPTKSRPIYSTIFTGKAPLDTNITHNGSVFLNNELFMQSFFSKMHDAKKTCAMAAHYWMREIYCNEAYSPHEHRLSIDENSPITYGIFYNNDDYPDEYVFQDAQCLNLKFDPQFLLVHSMGVDAAGHAHGANSMQYRNAVRKVDGLLAEYIPLWLAQENIVIVTSDHGMHADGAHNDTQDAARLVPYWILGATKGMLAPKNQRYWYNLLCEYYALFKVPID